MRAAEQDPAAAAAADTMAALGERVRLFDAVRPATPPAQAYVAQCRRLARIALAAVELDLARHAVPTQLPGQLAIDVESGR